MEACNLERLEKNRKLLVKVQKRCSLFNSFSFLSQVRGCYSRGLVEEGDPSPAAKSQQAQHSALISVTRRRLCHQFSKEQYIYHRWKEILFNDELFLSAFLPPSCPFRRRNSVFSVF